QKKAAIEARYALLGDNVAKAGVQAKIGLLASEVVERGKAQGPLIAAANAAAEKVKNEQRDDAVEVAKAENANKNYAEIKFAADKIKDFGGLANAEELLKQQIAGQTAAARAGGTPGVPVGGTPLGQAVEAARELQKFEANRDLVAAHDEKVRQLEKDKSDA